MNQKFCSVCNSGYKSKSDRLKSVKHLGKLGQCFCKNCNSYMPLSDKLSHLGWDEHNYPYPNESHHKINMTNLVIDNNNANTNSYQIKTSNKTITKPDIITKSISHFQMPSKLSSYVCKYINGKKRSIR